MGTTALLVSNFYSSVGIVFSFLPLFLTHMNYISFDVLYVLPSVKFKDSYYVVAVDNYFFFVEVFQFIMHFTISRRRILVLSFIIAYIVIMQNAVSLSTAKFRYLR